MESSSEHGLISKNNLLLSFFYLLFIELILCLSTGLYGGVFKTIYRQDSSGLSAFVLVIISLLMAVFQYSFLRILAVFFNNKGNSKLYFLISTAYLFCYWLTMLLSIVYYSRFGAFPDLSVLRDLVTTPRVALLYGLSGTAASEFLIVLLTIALIFVLSLRIAGQHAASKPHRIDYLFMPCSITLFLLSYAIVCFLNIQPRVNLSLRCLSPSASAINRIITAYTADSISLASEIFPLRPKEVFTIRKTTPQHVVLIVAEAIQAKHHPFYGYNRQTFPMMQANHLDWSTLSNPFAHGNNTAASFGVMFNNRYLAGIDGTSYGSSMVWKEFKKSDIKTAFLSAGTLEWAGMAEAISVSEVDFLISAKDFESPDKSYLSDLANDYAVDDSLVINKYRDFLIKNRANKSFAVLHLIGSHFPFLFPKVPNQFTPQLEEVELIQSSSHSPLSPLFKRFFSVGHFMPLNPNREKLYNEQLINSYDNGLLQIDYSIDSIRGILQEQNILEKSVIIFTADHGEAMGEHSNYFHGSSLYNEQIRVPLIIRMGKSLGKEFDIFRIDPLSITGLIDIIPSVFDLFGVKKPDFIEGSSVFSTESKTHEIAIQSGVGFRVAVVCTGVKYIIDLANHEVFKYDLKLDPEEVSPQTLKDIQDLKSFIEWFKLSIQKNEPG